MYVCCVSMTGTLSCRNHIVSGRPARDRDRIKPRCHQLFHQLPKLKQVIARSDGVIISSRRPPTPAQHALQSDNSIVAVVTIAIDHHHLLQCINHRARAIASLLATIVAAGKLADCNRSRPANFAEEQMMMMMEVVVMVVVETIYNSSIG